LSGEEWWTYNKSRDLVISRIKEALALRLDMSFVGTLCQMVAIVATATGCAGGRVVDLPTRSRVLTEVQSSHFEPAPNVLVLAKRINVCERGFMSEGSTTGIDAYLVRSDSNGGFTIPPRTFRRVCSKVVLLSTAFVPGYRSVSGRVVLGYDPNKAKQGLSDGDAILIPSIVDENRARELSGDLYSVFSSNAVNGDMARQIYHTMLPEIERLAQQTSRWHADCYRIGDVAEQVDKQVNKTTCNHYGYQPEVSR
jgi:hypothetical protein